MDFVIINMAGNTSWVASVCDQTACVLCVKGKGFASLEEGEKKPVPDLNTSSHLKEWSKTSERIKGGASLRTWVAKG